VAKKKKIGKKKSKRKITSYRTELKKLVATYVKNRDGWVCQRCKKELTSYDAHASHVIPTSQSEYLRYNALNIKTLCMRCHLFWWHKDPLGAKDWFEDNFPIRYAFLVANRYKLQKPSPDYFDNWIAKYKKLLEEQASTGRNG